MNLLLITALRSRIVLVFLDESTKKLQTCTTSKFLKSGSRTCALNYYIMLPKIALVVLPNPVPTTGYCLSN